MVLWDHALLSLYFGNLMHFLFGSMHNVANCWQFMDFLQKCNKDSFQFITILVLKCFAEFLNKNNFALRIGEPSKYFLIQRINKPTDFFQPNSHITHRHPMQCLRHQIHNFNIIFQTEFHIKFLNNILIIETNINFLLFLYRIFPNCHQCPSRTVFYGIVLFHLSHYTVADLKKQIVFVEFCEQWAQLGDWFVFDGLLVGV